MTSDPSTIRPSTEVLHPLLTAHSVAAPPLTTVLRSTAGADARPSRPAVTGEGPTGERSAPSLHAAAMTAPASRAARPQIRISRIRSPFWSSWISIAPIFEGAHDRPRQGARSLPGSAPCAFFLCLLCPLRIFERSFDSATGDRVPCFWGFCFTPLRYGRSLGAGRAGYRRFHVRRSAQAGAPACPL